MTSLAHHLATMAYNNGWANHRLLGACARLTTEEFVAERTSFFPSISKTLNHNLTVDWFYVDAAERTFAGAEPNPNCEAFFASDEPFPVCADLWAEQRAVDRRLVAVALALTEERLTGAIAIPRQAGIVHEATPRFFAHLLQHQIHHRGQAHAMLAGTRVPPPQLDEFFCANEAHKRAAELAELGWSEASIWAG